MWSQYLDAFTGVYEIEWHYQSAGHFRQDQPYRDLYLLEAVRRKDALVYWARLLADWEVYRISEVPEIDHKRPFYYDVSEGKAFIFTSGEDRIRKQLQLLTILLKGGGQLRI